MLAHIIKMSMAESLQEIVEELAGFHTSIEYRPDDKSIIFKICDDVCMRLVRASRSDYFILDIFEGRYLSTEDINHVKEYIRRVCLLPTPTLPKGISQCEGMIRRGNYYEPAHCGYYCRRYICEQYVIRCGTGANKIEAIGYGIIVLDKKILCTVDNLVKMYK
jgi:hypothetical protein